jgi:hypothetical protein
MAGIAAASAIVARPGHDPDDGEEALIQLYYEGNVHGAINLKRFHQRLANAAGRLLTRYPTIATVMARRADVILVATYEADTASIASVIDGPTLAGWAGEPLADIVGERRPVGPISWAEASKLCFNGQAMASGGPHIKIIRTIAGQYILLNIMGDGKHVTFEAEVLADDDPRRPKPVLSDGAKAPIKPSSRPMQLLASQGAGAAEQAARQADMAWFVANKGRRFYLRAPIEGEFSDALPAPPPGARWRTLTYNVAFDILCRLPLAISAVVSDDALSEAQLDELFQRFAPPRLKNNVDAILAGAPAMNQRH